MRTVIFGIGKRIGRGEISTIVCFFPKNVLWTLYG